MTEALGGVGVDALRLNGGRFSADLVAGLTDATVERSIEGASTLTLTIRDVHRTLLKSGIFGQRSTVQVDRFSFELAQVKKGGHDLTLVFEDLPVAALRRHDKPLKVAAGQMTRVAFVKRLISEERWIKVIAPVAGEKTLIEMARGTVASAGVAPEKETTWDASGRLMDEVQWRRFARDGAIWLAPEPYLLGQAASYTFGEYDRGIDFIDFDFDIGKPVATCTVGARADRWVAPPGTAVAIKDMGVATGKWLVSKISRSLFRTDTTVTLTKAQPVLPEPLPPPPPSTTGAGATAEGKDVVSTGVGKHVNVSAVTSAGYSWPVKGVITSGFGTRNGRLHAGIDIAVPVGTPVGAAAKGTVTYAGAMSGYGNVIIIRHSDGSPHGTGDGGAVFTRYGHVSAISCRAGQQVDRSEVIGLSGGAKGAEGSGDSTGPHVHFEVRPDDKPTDPRDFLP
jgi:murein DD-endopeptidase MepM/ murein hydrolase activator NlpD